METQQLLNFSYLPLKNLFLNSTYKFFPFNYSTNSKSTFPILIVSPSLTPFSLKQSTAYFAVPAVEFNTTFLKLKNETKDFELEPDKEIDLLVQSKEVYNFWIWVRAIICNVFDEHVTIRSPASDAPHVLKKNTYEYAKVGTYTVDWDWRCNLKEGDIISVDIGATYHGFVGDSAWTYPVGEITDEVKHLLKTTEESLFAGIAQM